MYNAILSLLAVLLILGAAPLAESPRIHPGLSGLFFCGKGLLFAWLSSRAFRKSDGAADYFSAEQGLGILAVISLAVDVFLLDARFYLAALPLADRLPVIFHLVGLFLFFGYQTLIWRAALPSYRRIFEVETKTGSFIRANLGLNLAMLLPWLFLSLFFELIRLLPIPFLVEFLDASPWGEALLVLPVLVLLLLFLPPVVIRLWRCTPMPDGQLRRQIETFCQSRGVPFADILLWPLFEGRMLTAGVMGLIGKTRYLLITPALLKALNEEEINAVVAHEIGHVKGFHLPLYLLLFLGFGLLVQLGSEPLLLLLLNSGLLSYLIALGHPSIETVLTLSSTLLLLFFALGYFRLVFGFFMRNFERQADLYALSAMGDAAPLIRVFEKIAWLGGKIRDLPNWHHFSIGQRIAFLERCRFDPKASRRHHRLVFAALVLYCVSLPALFFLVGQIDQDPFDLAAHPSLITALLGEKRKEDPANPLWHRLMADLKQHQGLYREAIEGYRHALSLAPSDPESINNLAWLLLTADDPRQRNPTEALALAKKAAALAKSPHILDTLATALWANGHRDEALRVEQEAFGRAGDNRDFYRDQMERFRAESYSEETIFPVQEEFQNP